MRLIDMISNFVSDNNLKDKQEELNAEHIEFKKLNIIMSASISYKDIKYTLEDDVLNFKKIKELFCIFQPNALNFLENI